LNTANTEPQQLSSIFKALGDPVRLRLFHLISLRDELCVCHLTEALALPQSTVSRQLAILRQAGLVATRRDGKWIHYRLAGEQSESLTLFVQMHADTLQRADAERLANAVGGCP
jgi:ArsR family transcriptional regulator